MKSSNLSSTSLQLDKTFWRVICAAVEQKEKLEIRPLRLTPESLQTKKYIS